MKGKQPIEGASRAQLRAALMRSGYLLESRLETILAKRDFRVLANGLYPDPETAKARELDLYASYARCLPCGPDENDFLSPVLIIECIHPPQPVAFLTKAWPDHFFEIDNRWAALKIAGPPLHVAHDEAESNWTWLQSTLQMPDYHHYASKRVATQFCSFEKKRSGNEWMATHREEDYEAFRKLADATLHYHDVTYRHEGVFEWRDDRPPILALEVFYPVLVVQGEILEAIAGARSLQLISRDHVQFRFSRMREQRISHFQIDVVTEHFFSDFIELILDEVAATGERMAERYAEVQEMIKTRTINEAKYNRSRDRS